MQAHVHYGSGYHPSQPYIQAFWGIVESMEPEDQVRVSSLMSHCCCNFLPTYSFRVTCCAS